MEVVAAGVHDAGYLGYHLPLLRRLLDDGVDVGPEGHGGPRLPAPEQGGAAGLHIQLQKLQAQAGQPLLQKGGGAYLPPAQLRVAVEVVLEALEGGQKGLCLIQ